MRVNADFSRAVIVAADQQHWTASPQGGVERVLLDRIGAEQARATSLVRYVPGAHFPRHVHPGGEEVLVLSGTFSDEGNDYPQGWYLRNPPGSAHRPSSRDGALIFVKLKQMSLDEKTAVRIDTRSPLAWRREGGRRLCPLFADAHGEVCIRRLDPGEPLFERAMPEMESLVISGHLVVDGRTYGQRSWMRLPAGEAAAAGAGARGATIYLRTGAPADARGVQP